MIAGLQEVVVSGAPAQILLVAGPSGAGKSTFIQCLKAGALPPQVRRLLPEYAAEWDVFEANDFLKRGIPVDAVALHASKENGLILHFDTAFSRRLGVSDYTRDPAFELLSRAPKVVIVSIHPLPETLQAQFEGRLQTQRSHRGRARELWRRAVHAPMRSLVRRLRGRRMVDTSRIYFRPDDLEQCYREWTVFARSLVRGKPGSTLICVEPRVDRDDRPTFVATPDPVEASG